MAQVLADSVIGYPQSLAIFSKPVQNCGVRQTKHIKYLPTNDYSTQGVIQFTVSGAGSKYLDLSKTILNLRVKIVEGDGKPLPKFTGKRSVSGSKTESRDSKADDDNEDNVDAEEERSDDLRKSTEATIKQDTFNTSVMTGVTNNFLHSMFSRVDVHLQNRLMTDSDGCYAYQAYFKTKLGTPADIKSGALQMQMFYDEGNPEYSTDCDWIATNYKGLKTRSSFFTGSQEVDLCGRLCSDIFDIDRLIPNGVPLQITLYPNLPQFCLLSPQILPPPDFKFVITQASLEVCFVTVAPEIVAAHSEILASEPALYPMTKTEVKKFAIAQGLFGAEINNPFEGRVPAEMVIGIVDGAASHGRYNSDPFYFEHCSLNYLQATCDGEDLSNSPMAVKFGETAMESQFIDGYKSLMGVGGFPGIVPMDRVSYFSGNTLFRFVREQEDSQSGDIMPLKRTGNVRLSLKFDKALTDPKTIIVFASFPSGFRIDKNRSVQDL